MLFNGWSGRAGSDAERDGDVFLLCLLAVAVATTEDILAATDDTLATTRDFFDSPPPVTLILDLVELLALDFLDATTAAKLPSLLGAAALAIDDLLTDIAEFLKRDFEEDETLEATFCIEDPRLDEAAPIQPESLVVTVAASNSCILLMDDEGC